MRTSSAARPPRTKKTNVETMYRMPIFLWSVVVNQAPTPRRSRAASECAGAGGRATTRGAVVVAIKFSFQGLEVRDDLGRFVVGQAEVGHGRAGLRGGW